MSQDESLNPAPLRVVYCTCPDEATARSLAHELVAAGVAACVNVLPAVTSVYCWQGECCTDPEVLLIIKTTAAAFPALQRLILKLHPYDVPEILALPVAAGHHDYLQWVRDQCVPQGTDDR